MGQAKQRGTAQERAESAIQSTIDATLAKIKTVLDRYYQDMPNNFSQAENYFTGYVAAFDIKDGMELEGKESEWAYDGLPSSSIPSLISNAATYPVKQFSACEKLFGMS
eukprot:TRINITY_DN110488_c0_g1_i1.p5 TRINITY_DN110488_c0_g1~~TRINITY_DN110488_c0_g1_i1.p5  ORF type:complete len:109 (+),score=7.03 TRINITY_DN110488_c0_g1_i1:325-651(+)